MTVRETRKEEGEGRSEEKQIDSPKRATHFSFVLCTAGPFSSAWVQTEAFPCYLKEDTKLLDV